MVTALATTWGWWSAFRPPWPYQWCSSWCSVATHSPHPAEALRHQTGNVAGLLSCNVLSGPPSSGEWDHSHRTGREKRHQEGWKVGFPDLDRTSRWELWNHGAGSVCRDASGRNKPQEHQSLNTFLCDERTHTHIHTQLAKCRKCKKKHSWGTKWTAAKQCKQLQRRRMWRVKKDEWILKKEGREV